MLIAFSPARGAIMKTYKQLPHELRFPIYALKKITQPLQVNKSTISR